MRCAAVVLAAGESRRMGRNKLLLKVGGRPMLDLLLAVLDASIVTEVFVVLGHRPKELKHLVEAHRAEAVINSIYKDGMFSSVKTGLERVSVDAAFFILGDQIGIRAELLERMAKAMELDDDVLIVSPVHEGKRGHPILIRSSLFPEMLRLDRHETLRDLVMRHERAHRLVEGDEWCVTDIDTPEDYERAKNRLLASRVS